MDVGADELWIESTDAAALDANDLTREAGDLLHEHPPQPGQRDFEPIGRLRRVHIGPHGSYEALARDRLARLSAEERKDVPCFVVGAVGPSRRQLVLP